MNGASSARRRPARAPPAASTTIRSPARTRWRLGARRGRRPAHAPASIRRCACAREPSGPARKRSRRVPRRPRRPPAQRDAPALTRAATSGGAAVQHEKQRQDAEVIAMSATLNAGHSGQLDEVGHRAGADPVDEVADRSADQQPGGNPQPGRVGPPGKVDQQQAERSEREDEHERAAAREEAERHTGVAHMDEFDARQELLRLSRGDRWPTRCAWSAGRAISTATVRIPARRHAAVRRLRRSGRRRGHRCSSGASPRSR